MFFKLFEMDTARGYIVLSDFHSWYSNFLSSIH